MLHYSHEQEYIVHTKDEENQQELLIVNIDQKYV